MNDGCINDGKLGEILSACGSAEEAVKLKALFFPEWRRTCCSSPYCEGNLQNRNKGADTKFLFVQNRSVADVDDSDASYLAGRLNTRCINACLAGIINKTVSIDALPCGR